LRILRIRTHNIAFLSPELDHVQVKSRAVQFFPLPFSIFLLPCSLKEIRIQDKHGGSATQAKSIIVAYVDYRIYPV
jgi:hypothetical protein